ncbi:MAG: phosphate transport system regulatory protein PhoU, partial [Candidatus Thermofonsia Clade 1 bacterium]
MVALRSTFDRQLKTLCNDLLRLAELVETQLVEAVRALQQRDFQAARRIDAFDAAINRLRYEIEEQSYTL